MKKLVSRTLILVMVLGFGFAALATAEDGTWTGWVTDSYCGGAKASAASHAECAAKCVKGDPGSPAGKKGASAKWALYNTTDKSLFVLSGDDAMMLKMAAKEVTVKGTMDKEKKTITVTSMEPMAPKKS
jgi:hypothetical protein